MGHNLGVYVYCDNVVQWAHSYSCIPQEFICNKYIVHVRYI